MLHMLHQKLHQPKLLELQRKTRWRMSGTRDVGVISKVDQSDSKILAAVQSLLVNQGPRSTSDIPWVAVIGQSVAVASAQSGSVGADHSLENAWRAESKSFKSTLTGALKVIAIAITGLEIFKNEAKNIGVALVDMEHAYVPPLHFIRLMQRSVRSIVVLNLPSYGSGRNPWGKLKPDYVEKEAVAQQQWTGKDPLSCTGFLGDQGLVSFIYYIFWWLLRLLCTDEGYFQAHPDDGCLEIFCSKHGWHASMVMAEVLSAKHIAQIWRD